ncbi:MAG: substrate-binding domain-containing protein [Bacteroidota bacterium]|jgi:phosphate transport system substrate-binding protein
MRSLCFVGIIALFLGCNTEEKETTTKGKLHVFIPESIAPVMIDEVNEFLNLYQANGAHITDTIVSTETVARRFVRDTARIAFLPRPLSQAEKEQIKTTSTGLNELIIAYDAIVAVVHPRNKIVEMTTTEIQNILSGTTTQWEQLTKPMKGTIHIYCQDSSDVTEYLKQRLLKQEDISTKFTRTSSDIQTLRLVEKDPLALGFVALAWIDSAKSDAKILNLGRTSEDIDTTFVTPAETMGNFFSPHPANIYRNYYPLKRAIYMYTKGQVDLAAGFGTYVATSEGQKLFLKRGLLPGTQKIKLKSNQPE